MTGERISVIIPVYNVEAYLGRCLDSVCGQTYENLEILLIDDGSSDASGEICDRAAAEDKRILVWHTENGGPSAARNLGIEKASADYLLFVDSDDIIAPDYIAFLYMQLKENDADLAVCGFEPIEGDRPPDREEKRRIVLKGSEALEDLLYQRHLNAGPWCKLYRSKLFAGVRFPIGTLYEDTLAVAQAVGNAEKTVYSDAVKYGYFQRAGSTMRSDYNPKTYQYVEVAEQLLQYVQEHYPDLTPAAISRYVWANLFVWIKLPGKSRESKYQGTVKTRMGNKTENETEITAVRSAVEGNIKKYRRQVLKNPKVRRINKMVLLLSYLGHSLTQRVYLLTQ